MKKFIGSIVIMLVLVQPITSDCAYNVKAISINIFQEYKQYLALNIGKSEEEKHTLEDLSSNMELITKLIQNKNEVVASIQSIMNKKVEKKEMLSDTQISKFQQFIKISDNHSMQLKKAFNNINAKKDLKIIQQAILKSQIDYATVSNEINSVYDSQNNAMHSLNEIIEYGDNLLKVL